MIKISDCKINGIDALLVQVQGGRVTADIGFTIDFNPFGTVTVAGLDEDAEVRDAASALQMAVEAAIVKRLGSLDAPVPTLPRGLLDPTL